MTQWPGAPVENQQQWPGQAVEQPRQRQPEKDKYRLAAEEDARRSDGPAYSRLQSQVMQGLTLGASDEIMAGLMTPLEMIRRGTFSPVEGYNYAKAREDLELERARARDGLVGTAAEIAAGVGSGTALARGGLTLAGKTANAGLAARSGAMAAEGAGYGAVTGFNTGSGENRLANAGIGAATGGVIGGALPGVSQVVSTAAAPVVSNISARINPDRFARNQVARAISESGRAPQQIIDDVATAAREGQGVYTVADALGDSGQRMLGTVANNPGRGSQVTREFLDARQAEQGRRMAGALDDAFGASTTRQQLQAAQEAARSAEANSLYGQAREAAGAVDVSGAIRQADDILQPGVTRVMSPQTNIADNTIESAVNRARQFLTDGRSNLSDFRQVHLAKQEIDSLIERGTSQQQRALIPIRNELDKALEAASAPYAQARNAYRDASKAIEAVDTGRLAAQRGRTEDTIPAFQRLSPREQEGYRVGYADPLIERIQGSAQGVNKAREFTSDAMRAELPAFARPGEAGLLGRRIERENTMFGTRARATGNSTTADRLNADAATGVSPEVIGNVLTGNFMGAARNLMSRSGAALNGNTSAVRERLADLLLARGANAQQVGTLLTEASKSAETRKRLMELLTRGAIGGGAVAPDAFSLPATNGR